MIEENQYTEDNIRSLDWKEHIRMRPGMYIGKLGDGSSPDDGIYILVKEVIDNSIDEFVMGSGRTIEVTIKDKTVTVRDYGRGIPLGKVVDVVSKMNTGGKYDSLAFKKSVGLNGVGTKAVNALSSYFRVESVRDNQQKGAEFSGGSLVLEEAVEETTKRKGTKVAFIPDETIFKNYKFRNEYVEKMLKNYCYLNTGLTIIYNGEKFFSDYGLRDLLEENIAEEDRVYPIIHLKADDIEIAVTHSKTQYSEEYHSFVNGQNTTQGGTHLGAFREAIVKTIKEFYNKNFEASDVRKSIVSAISVKVMEPVFESQTKTKLGSTEMGDGLPSVRTFINDFVKNQLNTREIIKEFTNDSIHIKISSKFKNKELVSVNSIYKTKDSLSDTHIYFKNDKVFRYYNTYKNKSGYITKWTSHPEDKESIYKVIYIELEDKKKNWIRREVFINEKLTEIIIRKIKY